METSHFEKLLLLGRCESFAGISPDLLGLLADEATATRFDRGRDIVTEGEPIESLYAVSYGSLVISVGGELVEDEIRAGDLIGDHEMITGEVTSKATATVSSEYAWLLHIPRSSVRRVMEEQPEYLVALARAFALRLKRMQKKVHYWSGLLGRIAHDLSMLESLISGVRRVAEDAVAATFSKVELRFLVEVDHSRLEKADHRRLEQAYVVLEPQNEIRIRREDDQFSIAGKQDYGTRRKEIELQLDQRLYDALLTYGDDRRVSKTRYTLHHLGHEWRIDVFDADTKCSGLSVAEVDIVEGEDVPETPPGIIIVRDISADLHYRNRSLAENGLPHTLAATRASETEGSVREDRE